MTWAGGTNCSLHPLLSLELTTTIFILKLKVRPGHEQGSFGETEHGKCAGFCLEGLQPLNASRFFHGMHMKCDLAKLSLESPHRHFKTSQC